MAQHSRCGAVTIATALTVTGALLVVVVIIIGFVVCVCIVLRTAVAVATAMLRFIVGLLRLLITAGRNEWVTAVAAVAFVVAGVDVDDFRSTHCRWRRNLIIRANEVIFMALASLWQLIGNTVVVVGVLLLLLLALLCAHIWWRRAFAVNVDSTTPRTFAYFCCNCFCI